MIYRQKWYGARIHNGIKGESFCAEVPGNIQYDYALANNFKDVYFADGSRQFYSLEEDSWEYSTRLNYRREHGEGVRFVSLGINYKYKILANFVKAKQDTPFFLRAMGALKNEAP